MSVLNRCLACRRRRCIAIASSYDVGLNVMLYKTEVSVSELVVDREEKAHPGCGTRRVYAGLV